MFITQSILCVQPNERHMVLVIIVNAYAHLKLDCYGAEPTQHDFDSAISTLVKQVITRTQTWIQCAAAGIKMP